MNPRYSLHTLGRDDLALFRSMLGLFGEAFEDRATYLDRQLDDDYIRGLLVDSTFIAIVARSSTETVGALAGYVLKKFEQPRSEFYIYDLAVPSLTVGAALPRR